MISLFESYSNRRSNSFGLKFESSLIWFVGPHRLSLHKTWCLCCLDLRCLVFGHWLYVFEFSRLVVTCTSEILRPQRSVWFALRVSSNTGCWSWTPEAEMRLVSRNLSPLHFTLTLEKCSGMSHHFSILNLNYICVPSKLLRIPVNSTLNMFISFTLSLHVQWTSEIRTCSDFGPFTCVPYPDTQKHLKSKQS